MVNIEPAFVADAQAPHARKPCQGALDDPAVAAQPFAAFHASARNARLDAALAASAAAAPGIVRLVGVQLVWSLARPAAPAFERHHRIEQFSQRHTVMHMGTREHERQRQAIAVGQQVALCARLASVRRVISGSLADLAPELRSS